MKKGAKIRILAFLGAMITLFSLVSCSGEPYDYDLDEYIVLPSFDDISVTDAEIRQMVSEQIEQARKNNVKKELVTSRGAIYGDLVELSFKCYTTQEVEISDLSDSACALILGENKYPELFEDSLVRRISGDTFRITVTLPQSVTYENLGGQQIIYEGTVNAVYSLSLPEYDDAFVKAVSDLSTMAEYEAMLYDAMKEQLIFDKLLEKTEILKYPSEEVQAYVNSYVRYYTEAAREVDTTLEAYVAKKFFISITDFHVKADLQAKELVRQELLLYGLANEYKISVSDADYEQGAKKYAEKYGLSSVSELEGRFGTAYIRQTLLMDKLLEFLSEQIMVSEGA